VLIVDNDRSHAETIAEAINASGGTYDCTLAFSGKFGAQLLEREPFDIIITDLMLGDLDGLELLSKAKSEWPDCEVIVVTGYGNIPSAVAAMSQGALNYLEKPLDLKRLRAVVARAAENIQLRRTNLELHRRLDEKFGFKGVIGSSPTMHDLIVRLQRIAPTNSTVLILGETGTGKELVAQAIHQNSRRKNKRFVDVNPSAISSQLVESELFGHIKGAFTDASSDRQGMIEYAYGGTLFIDEVGDMPMPTQIKLLRVLESKEITRVGSNERLKVDARIVSATNRDLEKMVKEGTFREDLYYRLNVVTVRLPPLRERKEDIPLLIENFFRQFGREHEKTVRGVTAQARHRLIAYSWPGNVRELRNVIEEMVVNDVDGVLDLDDLPERLQAPRAALLPAPAESPRGLQMVGKKLDELEKLAIQETLQFTGGNREEAARMLGIPERTLYRRLREYGLS